jgi:hypothetical protein
VSALRVRDRGRRGTAAASPGQEQGQHLTVLQGAVQPPIVFEDPPEDVVGMHADLVEMVD